MEAEGGMIGADSNLDSTGRVEHEIVHVPWKLKIIMPCKTKVSIAARNLSPNGN
jgi:hypothetical protein